MPLEAPVITATLLELFMAIPEAGRQRKLANVTGQMPTLTCSICYEDARAKVNPWIPVDIGFR
jgi:hypothetical protein